MKIWMRSVLASLKEGETPFFWGIFIVLILFRIWLITGIPKILVYGPHDDLFFAKAAHHIIHGQWMGPYTQMTLIKGPFYAFFLIFSFFTGLPLFLNETLFYVVACIVTYFAFSPLIKNRWWRLLLYTILCYVPVSLPTLNNLKVYREFVYFSLTLYVVAFSIGLFLRLDEKAPKLIRWSIGLGLSMGAFMLTREEGVWIYPVLFSLLVVCVVIIWVKKIDKKWMRSGIVILPVLLWYIPIILVSSLNFFHYGFWGVSEQLDPDFNRALNTLGRIESSTWLPFIPITAEARMKAYEASPLLNELKDSIESAVVAWQPSDDLSTNLKPAWYIQEYTDGGSEIGAHFIWLLRDVVYSAGFYESGKYPHAFYEQLADQLESACYDRELDCSPAKSIPLIGSIDPRHYPIIARIFFEDVHGILDLDGINLASLDVRDWPAYHEEFKYFSEFVYNSIDSQGIHSGENQYYIVDGSTDARIKVLTYKESITKKIVGIYKKLTLPIFVLGFTGWILMFSKKPIDSIEAYLVTSIFAVGLFFSRLVTLAVVDATTSISGLLYADSCYIFLYIFSFITFYWIFEIYVMRIYHRGDGKETIPETKKGER